MKQELKRQGIIGNEKPVTIRLDANTDITAIPVDSETVDITEKASLKEFASQPAMESVPADKVEALYNEGITSTEDLKEKSEEDLLSIKGVGPATIEKIEASASVSGKYTLEDFAALKEVADIRADLVETLYNEGITSSEAFGQWTEKEIIDINGIGQGTVDKLKENGVAFKK